MDKDIVHPRKKGYEGNTEIVRAQVTEEMLATLSFQLKILTLSLKTQDKNYETYRQTH